MAKWAHCGYRQRTWCGHDGMLACCLSHCWLGTDTCPSYIQKFYQMRTQLQAISLRIQVNMGMIHQIRDMWLIASRRFAAMSR